MYLTHYGRVDDAGKLAGDLYEQIDAMTAIGRSCDRDDRHRCMTAALTALYQDRARNALGLARWLYRDRR